MNPDNESDIRSQSDMNLTHYLGMTSPGAAVASGDEWTRLSVADHSPGGLVGDIFDRRLPYSLSWSDEDPLKYVNDPLQSGLELELSDHSYSAHSDPEVVGSLPGALLPPQDQTRWQERPFSQFGYEPLHSVSPLHAPEPYSSALHQPMQFLSSPDSQRSGYGGPSLVSHPPYESSTVPEPYIAQTHEEFADRLLFPPQSRVHEGPSEGRYVTLSDLSVTPEPPRGSPAAGVLDADDSELASLEGGASEAGTLRMKRYRAEFNSPPPPIHAPSEPSSEPIRKRPCRTSPARASAVYEKDVHEPASATEESDFDGDDSDIYLPSRSPSFSPPSPSPSRGGSHSPEYTPSGVRKTRKGKAKGSGALALLAFQPTRVPTTEGTSSESNEDTRTGVRTRKNHVIPLPVPVPNLTKSSRGRKVPYVAAVGARDDDGDFATAGAGVGGGRRRGRGNGEGGGGDRSFVCTVPGCGKCFIRGEHLKRHVRSIHTFEKPHSCPYPGCDKSFSRRDNLGQHVRVHL